MLLRTLLLLVFASSGCASVSVVKPVKTGPYEPENTGEDIGITYYEPMFVLAVSCSEGKASAEIKPMPDYNKPRTVRWSNGLFTNANPTVELGDGWRLASFNGEVTSTIGDVVGAVGTLGEAVISVLAVNQPNPVAIDTAGLYRLEWSQAGWRVNTQAPLLQLGKCKSPEASSSPKPTPGS